MLRNLAQKIKNYMVLAPQTLTADVNSTSVDLEALRSFGFIVSVGAFTFTGTNKVALVIQDSDDNVAFTSTTDLKELVAAADANKTHLVEYKGNKRYVRLLLDVSGTVSVATSVIGHSSDLEIQPS
jgi:hypothetical protein